VGGLVSPSVTEFHCTVPVCFGISAHYFIIRLLPLFAFCDMMLPSTLQPSAENDEDQTERTLTNLLTDAQIDWEAVTSRAHSHPREAEHSCHGPVDQEHRPFLGHAILHRMVKLDPPPHAVEAVVEAYPLAVTQLNVDYRPLVIACHHSADPEVLRILIRSYLRLRDVATEGWTIFSHMNPAAMSLPRWRVLLEEYPEGAQEDAFLVGRFSGSLHRPVFYFLKSMEEVEDTASLAWKRELFEKLSWTLQAIASGSLVDQSPSSFCPLHELLRFLSRFKPYDVLDPLPMLRYMRDHEPAMFGKSDEQGSTPVHIVVADAIEKRFSFHRCCGKNKSVEELKMVRAIIQFLLDVSPESACMPDANGQLVWHVAIQGGLYCWDAILSVAPQKLLETRCPETRLYPFQLAAIRRRASFSKKKSKKANAYDSLGQFDMMYQLLRMNPSLILIKR
jgi:hypothetical protein